MVVHVLDQVHQQEIATPTTAQVSSFLVFFQYSGKYIQGKSIRIPPYVFMNLDDGHNKQFPNIRSRPLSNDLTALVWTE